MNYLLDCKVILKFLKIFIDSMTISNNVKRQRQFTWYESRCLLDVNCSIERQAVHELFRLLRKEFDQRNNLIRRHIGMLLINFYKFLLLNSYVDSFISLESKTIDRCKLLSEDFLSDYVCYASDFFYWCVIMMNAVNMSSLWKSRCFHHFFFWE